jgi:hypothetical protein
MILSNTKYKDTNTNIAIHKHQCSTQDTGAHGPQRHFLVSSDPSFNLQHYLFLRSFSLFYKIFVAASATSIVTLSWYISLKLKKQSDQFFFDLVKYTQLKY